MVYHVYLNWDKNEYNGRVILTFPSRQYADEFYNRCITAKGPDQGYLLPEIDRKAPQFWTSSNAAEDRPYYFLAKNAPDLIPTVMIQRISGYDAQYGGGLPIILNDPTSLVEYKSGRAYYIRTKAQPHLYWSLEQSGIYLNERRATKFRIDRDDSRRKDNLDDRVVLVNGDDVSLTALTAQRDDEIGVGANRTLVTNQSSLQFGFGGFYNGSFGVQWPAGDGKPWVVYRAKHTGEEWELIY